MKPTKQEKIESLTRRGYSESINPNTKQIQMRKGCQLKVEKFTNLNEDGSIKWTLREGTDMYITLVECALADYPDFKVKANLNKASWEQNPVEIGKIYSAIAQVVVTEKGTNALSPSVDKTYFTLFSNVGTAVSSSSLQNVGL